MFKGKKVVVFGVANKKSIAWGIAQSLTEQGAELCLTYPNDAMKKRVEPLAEELGCNTVLECDVQSDEHLDKVFAELKDKWGTLDGVVHSVAFANRDDLSNPFSETSRAGFHLAMDISAYSLVTITNRAKHLMPNGGSIIALTYLGAERIVPNYNVMGVAKAALEASVRYLAGDLGKDNIRINGISSGPIKTLAASGIPKFRDLLNQFADTAPLKRTTDVEDVAKTALFLLSDMSSGITAETLYVDCGFNKMGLV